MRAGVHTIYSHHLESTAFTHTKMQLLLSSFSLNSGVRLAKIPVVDFVFTFFFITSPQHFLRRDGVQNIYYERWESTACTHQRWSPKHLFMRDGVHSTYSRDIESTAFTLGRCSLQNILMRDGYVKFTHERWSPLLLRDGLRSIY